MALDANFEELEKGTGQIPLIGDAFFNGTHGDSQGNSHAYLGEGVTKTNMDIDPGLRNYTPQDLNDLFDGTADEKKLTDRLLMMTAISVMANSNGNIISDFLQNMIEEQKTLGSRRTDKICRKNRISITTSRRWDYRYCKRRYFRTWSRSTSRNHRKNCRRAWRRPGSCSRRLPHTRAG